MNTFQIIVSLMSIGFIFIGESEDKPIYTGIGAMFLLLLAVAIGQELFYVAAGLGFFAIMIRIAFSISQSDIEDEDE